MEYFGGINLSNITESASEEPYQIRPLNESYMLYLKQQNSFEINQIHKTLILSPNISLVSGRMIDNVISCEVENDRGSSHSRMLPSCK